MFASFFRTVAVFVLRLVGSFTILALFSYGALVMGNHRYMAREFASTNREAESIRMRGVLALLGINAVGFALGVTLILSAEKIKD